MTINIRLFVSGITSRKVDFPPPWLIGILWYWCLAVVDAGAGACNGANSYRKSTKPPSGGGSAGGTSLAAAASYTLHRGC